MHPRRPPKTTSHPDADGRKLSAETAINQIKERFGDGAIMRLGEARTMQVEVLPTDCLSLDVALGVGGLPRGRIVEVYGPEASGKTTLALHAVAAAQRRGGTAAFVDAEHALDPSYAARLGVKVNDLLISQPDTGEQALEIVETLVRSGAIDIIVVDSVAALTPKAEIEGDMGDQHMGLQARLMSQALRKLTSISAKSKTVIVFINQIRMKIGVIFGNPETTPGGTALKFYSSVRIEVRRSAQLKQGDVVIGNVVNCKLVKNKVAPPFQTTSFEILYNEGINLIGDVLETGVRYGVLQKAGASYGFGEVKLGVGRDAAKRFLAENGKVLKQIKEAVWQRVREAKVQAPQPTEESTLS